jgi:hypothetical protein
MEFDEGRDTTVSSTNPVGLRSQVGGGLAVFGILLFVFYPDVPGNAAINLHQMATLFICIGAFLLLIGTVARMFPGSFVEESGEVCRGRADRSKIAPGGSHRSMSNLSICISAVCEPHLFPWTGDHFAGRAWRPSSGGRRCAWLLSAWSMGTWRAFFRIAAAQGRAAGGHCRRRSGAVREIPEEVRLAETLFYKSEANMIEKHASAGGAGVHVDCRAPACD